MAWGFSCRKYCRMMVCQKGIPSLPSGWLVMVVRYFCLNNFSWVSVWQSNFLQDGMTAEFEETTQSITLLLEVRSRSYSLFKKLLTVQDSGQLSCEIISSFLRSLLSCYWPSLQFQLNYKVQYVMLNLQKEHNEQTTLHGIPSYKFLAELSSIFENVQKLDHHHHHHSIISITVAILLSYQVVWQESENEYQDNVQFGCVNIILCFLAHLANTFFSVINLCPPYGACSWRKYSSHSSLPCS